MAVLSSSPAKVAEGRRAAYIGAAVRGELSKLRSAGKSERNSILNEVAFKIGTLGLNETQVANIAGELHSTAMEIGLRASEAIAAIRSGMRAGAKKQGRALPFDVMGGAMGGIHRLLIAAERDERPWPPKREVFALWEASMQPGSVPDHPGSRYLVSRGFSLRDIDGLQIVRISPPPRDHHYPAFWPAGREPTWPIITPIFDAEGQMVSLHGRACRDGYNKCIWPFSDGKLRVVGIMADARAQWVLRNGRNNVQLDSWLIVEGLTDFVSACILACRTLALQGKAVAVIGYASGADAVLKDVQWPSGIPVKIWTDPDDAGRTHAKKIAASIPNEIDLETLE